jgi:hypothetical protein
MVWATASSASEMLSVKSRTSWSSILSGSSALSRIAFTFARTSCPIRPRIDD